MKHDKRRYNKSTRAWLSPEYITWRNAVFRRDGYRCRMPRCGSKIKIQAHHIKRWSDCPGLRFDVGNGITLCNVCHKSVTKNEEQFEKLFLSLLNTMASNERMHRLLKDE